MKYLSLLILLCGCAREHNPPEPTNEKGVAGIWECRPSCNSKLSNDEAILAAIKGDQP